MAIRAKGCVTSMTKKLTTTNIFKYLKICTEVLANSEGKGPLKLRSNGTRIIGRNGYRIIEEYMGYMTESVINVDQKEIARTFSSLIKKWKIGCFF